MYLFEKKYDPETKEDITKEIMYWRKVNAIHKWFVENVQEGNDDCKEYKVSKDQLKELLKTVKQILKNPTLADTLLPTQEGCFFGPLEYDEYYFEHLEYTRKTIEEILADPDIDKRTLVYQSSW
jgi:hypothetical protein